MTRIVLLSPGLRGFAPSREPVSRTCSRARERVTAAGLPGREGERLLGHQRKGVLAVAPRNAGSKKSIGDY